MFIEVQLAAGGFVTINFNTITSISDKTDGCEIKTVDGQEFKILDGYPNVIKKLREVVDIK